MSGSDSSANAVTNLGPQRVGLHPKLLAEKDAAQVRLQQQHRLQNLVGVPTDPVELHERQHQTLLLRVRLPAALCRFLDLTVKCVHEARGVGLAVGQGNTNTNRHELYNNHYVIMNKHSGGSARA